MNNHKGNAATPRDELGELTQEEIRVVVDCRKLNSHGREAAVKYVAFLARTERFRKGVIDFQRARCRAIDAGEVRK